MFTNRAGMVRRTGAAALILVGGYGTRLRPLTLTVPKPLVPFANVPMLTRQIAALRSAGVATVVLATGEHCHAVTRQAVELESVHGIDIVFSVEQTPLGTAGPLALARQHLQQCSGPFFVLNSDVICEYPLRAMMDYHLSHGRKGTVLATQAADPAKYGVLLADTDTQQIRAFVEKPQTHVGSSINAGIYVLDPSVLDALAVTQCSLERDVFPALAEQGELCMYSLGGWWMDIGQPRDFLAGQRLYLRSEHEKGALHSDVLVGKRVHIGEDAQISDCVVLGDDVHIGRGVRIANSTVLSGARIADYCHITDSIVGWDCTLGRWTRIDHSVLGSSVATDEGVCLRGCTVLPQERISHGNEDGV